MSIPLESTSQTPPNLTTNYVINWMHRIEPPFFASLGRLGSFMGKGKGVHRVSGKDDLVTGMGICDMATAILGYGAKKNFGSQISLSFVNGIVADQEDGLGFSHWWGRFFVGDEPEHFFDPTHGQKNEEYAGKIAIAPVSLEPAFFEYTTPPEKFHHCDDVENPLMIYKITHGHLPKYYFTQVEHLYREVISTVV